MLSRVAERIYWLARYLERAENTARLVNVYGGLLLDLPRATGLGWDVVLDITGCGASVEDGDTRPGPRAMLRHLLYAQANPGSLLGTLEQARENARTTRDLVPTEAWRAVNELCLYARARLPKADQARQRAEVMGELVMRVQAITGLLAGTMSHGQAYQFLRLGRNLERADMSTRMIDVAAAVLMSGRPELRRFDNTLWMAVLRSLSGYQMYRQYVRRRVQGPDVIGFLLQDTRFPRAVAHCAAELEVAMARLPRHQAAGLPVAAMRTRLAGLDPAGLDSRALHELVDQLQLDIAAINDAVVRTWFHLDRTA